MKANQLVLPLENTPTSRLLAWVTGAIVYAVVLAVAAMSLAHAKISELRSNPRMMTIAVPPMEASASGDAVDELLILLRDHPAVLNAAEVASAEVDDLVSPFVPENERTAVALPRLIDVTLDPAVDVSESTLRRSLEQSVPGIAVSGEWALDRSHDRLAHLLRTAAVLVTASMLVSAALIVVGVTRWCLRTHDDLVDLLRQMGAHDSFVARQFEHFAMSSSLTGGAAGLAVGLVTVVVTLEGMHLLGNGGSAFGLQVWHWLLFLLVPVVISVVMTATARLTALAGLAANR